MFYGKQRYLIAALSLISICTFLCSSAKATDYFEGPSSDNNYFVPFLNSGDTVTLTQHQIKELYLISNPFGIVKSTVIPYEPFGDVELSPGESVELKIGPLDFGNVETKQQCEDFSNPVIYISTEAEEPLIESEDEIEIPVKPEGFERATGESYEKGDCMITPMEACECESGSCSYRRWSERDCFDDDHPPDENHIISEDDYAQFRNYDPESRIGVLATGFVENAMSLLDAMHVSARLVDGLDDLGAGTADEVHLLIVPSNGFAPYYNLETFSRNFEDFLSSGGNAIVLAQGRDDYWESLPGNIDAFGYSQDVSCFRRGSRLAMQHPVLSSEEHEFADVHLDGFFVNYPPETDELLIRESNSQPSAIVYPFGEGTVIATNMYPDYAYSTGQYNKDELHYVRDMITWSLEPAELGEYSPGNYDPDFDFTLELPADAPSAVTSARYKVLSPDRDEVLVDETISVSLAAGETLKVSVEVPELPGKLVSYQ